MTLTLTLSRPTGEGMQTDSRTLTLALSHRMGEGMASLGEGRRRSS